MGDPAKRRKRAKEKQLEARRRRGVSPWELMGRGGECAIYINGNWRATNMMSMWAFRPSLNGGWAAAAFLIDLDCLGLKDAFVKNDCSKTLVMERMAEQGGAERITLDEAKRWIAAAMRWSNDHGFRITGQPDKAMMMLGGIGDWRAADVSAFAPSGKLRYIGSEHDLEKRLIGRTPQDFFREEAVEYAMGVGADDPRLDQFAGDLADDDDDDMDDEVAQAKEICSEMAHRAAGWLTARGKEPSELLHPAARAVASALLKCSALPEAERKENLSKEINWFLDGAPVETRETLESGITQILDFIAATQPKELFRSLQELV